VPAVLTALVAPAGIAGALALSLGARRADTSARARGLAHARRWLVPARVRPRLERALALADVRATPEEAAELWGAGVLASIMLTEAIAPALLLPAVGLAVAAGPLALRLAAGRHARAFAVALPRALEDVAAELRAGGTVPTAIQRLAEGEGPVVADLRRIRARQALGMAFADALSRWPSEHDAPGVRASAGALTVAAELGGRAAGALDGLAASLRHRLEVADEARALSSQARLSAVVVAAAPVGYLAFTSAVDRSSASALTSTGLGRVCLVVGLALDALAVLWIRGIVGSQP
jgi:tight adherence protein B